MAIKDTFRTIFVMMELELRKIKHDRTELYFRAVQPILWLVVYGTIMNTVRAIDTGELTYIEYIFPGIVIHSTIFVSIFYGLQLVWERESGILKKLLVTPASRSATVIGRSMAAGIRAWFQTFLLLPFAIILGVRFMPNVGYFILSMIIIFISSGGFAAMSIIIASFMKSRERFMGIGQAITFPLFFCSSALYPINLMPQAIQIFAKINPLSYMISALRSLFVSGDLSMLLIDIGVILFFIGLMFSIASLCFKRIIQ